MAAVHFTAAILSPRTTVYGLKLEELLHSHICVHQTSITQKWVDLMGDWNRNVATFLSTLMTIQTNIFYNEQYYIGILEVSNHANANILKSPATIRYMLVIVGWHVGPQL